MYNVVCEEDRIGLHRNGARVCPNRVPSCETCHVISHEHEELIFGIPLAHMGFYCVCIIQYVLDTFKYTVFLYSCTSTKYFHMNYQS